jgi:hypothetical protein
MKRAISIVGITVAITASGAAQQPAPESPVSIEWTSQGSGMARTALETRVTRGQPYSGDAITEFVQVLADGNRIVRRTSTRLYRDSDGRTRRETISEGSNSASDLNTIVITDPVAGVSLLLDPRTRTAQKMPGMFARVSSGAAAATGGPLVEVIQIPPGAKRRVETATVVATPPDQHVRVFAGAPGVKYEGPGPGPGTKEDLGQQVIEGVMAVGTRTTTTIPAGAIGNEQPLTIVSEQWFSPELEVLVVTKHNDPRVGETSYKLTNLARGEPDRALFQVPADYTLKEMMPRKPSPMWQQQ